MRALRFVPRLQFGLLIVVGLSSCGPRATPPTPIPTPTPTPAAPDLREPREAHFGAITQLTHGGENAEAYWASDGRSLIFQSTRPPYECDQIFTMPATSLEGKEPRLISSGEGRTTCSYFFPGNRTLLYSSTHLGGVACPPKPDHSKGYVWPLYDTYDIFSGRADGGEIRRLTDSKGYDAEATICPVDGSIIFTSTRDGDIELYRMDPDGKNVVRLTRSPGYDGGAFFSADCKKIVWRASRPLPGAELDDYNALLAQGLVRPTRMELWVANADGSEARQITFLGAASFAPYFYPSGDRIIFSSNYGDAKGREFDIWAVDVDGTDLERITWSPGFDGFPMFSPDGAKLAFSSNRNQAHEGDTDVYVADWLPAEPAAGAVMPTAADRFLVDVAWLADDARGGRGVGTQGLVDSAAYLEQRFADIGVEPAGEDGYRHGLEVRVSVGRGEGTSLAIDGEAVPAEAFTPLGFATAADAAGDVVAAGYGITAPELAMDDYKGVKAKGKIVVVRRFVPDDDRFADDKLERRFGDPRWKAWNAREHGAKALIIVDLPIVKKGKPVPADAALPRLELDTRDDAGIPVVVITRAAGEKLLDKKRHKADLKVVLTVDKQRVWNVLGRIRAGAEPRRDGVIVVGAHYDHLGLGGTASLAPGVNAPHNGADDNASGTAALLLVAEELVKRRAELERDVIIAAFSAEEMGALGSTAFVRKPPGGVAMADVVAMLNMDMVGRLRGNELVVSGTETAGEWEPLVNPACAARRLSCKIGGDGFGASDHMPFYAAGVPVLHFFTGAHREYHTPQDDVPLLNAAGGAHVAGLVAELAVATDRIEKRLTLRAVPAPPPSGDMRSRGGSLGTVPDYGGPPEGKTGVLLAGVRPGGPAEAAGLKRGDLLIQIDSHKIRNVEDFMYVLRKSSPGEKAKVVVERDGKKVEVEVTFGQSTRR